MKSLRIFLLVLLALAAGDLLNAQCAMCRATAESATEHVDKGIGEGLNGGILYLMGIPYLLLAAGILVFFRRKLASIFRS
ncbi:MAG: hypothetical protein ACK5XV_05305 [Flavobacteriales bacterium]